MAALRARASRRTSSVRVLGDADLPEALALCGRDSVASVLATSRLEAAMATSLATTGGQLWGYPAAGPLVALCWAGANLVPVVPEFDAEILAAFADEAAAQGRRCSSIVGSVDPVLGIWARLAGRWSTPREIRAEQPSLVISTDPLVAPDPNLRRSNAADYLDVLPACVAMFEEEVGYSPMTFAARAYQERVRCLIADGRSYIVRESEPTGNILFKAEIGAVGGQVAQVQGVWVDPQHRGTGLSAPGMAAVVLAARASIAPTVSLYANGFNTRALATYRRVGFEQVGTYATVLF